MYCPGTVNAVRLLTQGMTTSSCSPSGRPAWSRAAAPPTRSSAQGSRSMMSEPTISSCNHWPTVTPGWISKSWAILLLLNSRQLHARDRPQLPHNFTRWQAALQIFNCPIAELGAAGQIKPAKVTEQLQLLESSIGDLGAPLQVERLQGRECDEVA